jgi:poly-gamma-glutamate synthesis protein (capsule biosynthesis protein)
MGNLECPISERGEPERKGYTFRAPASAVAALQNGGFDVLTLANNHALDYGLLAFQDTLDLLAQAGIKTIGAGLNETSAYAPVMLTVKGVRLAFLAYARYPTEGASGYQGQSAVASGDRPGIAWAELERIKRDVVSAKAQADLVIVALHAGQEYAESPDDLQRQAARAAIDAGACLVWGHHPHVLQGIEFYRDGVILYSLGDFVFDQMPDNDTVIARVRLDRRGARQVELLPVTIVENGRPASADAAQGQRILRRVYSLSDVLR